MKTIFIVLFVNMCFPIVFLQQEIGKKLDEIKRFAEESKPTYFHNGDTLVVARIPTPPDSINSFLYYCLENEIYESDKYAFLLVLKLQEEYLKVNKSDYDFCDYENNGVIDLVLKRMNIKYDEIGCSFTKTNDVFLWIKDNIKKFNNYAPINEQIIENERLINELVNERRK